MRAGAGGRWADEFRRLNVVAIGFAGRGDLSQAAHLGGLRGDDRWLFVSTGGFTKEAMYEAERATVPVNLVDLDLLAALLVQHYEQLDNDGRALVSLLRFYWPA